MDQDMSFGGFHVGYRSCCPAGCPQHQVPRVEVEFLAVLVDWLSLAVVHQRYWEVAEPRLVIPVIVIEG